MSYKALLGAVWPQLRNILKSELSDNALSQIDAIVNSGEPIAMNAPLKLRNNSNAPGVEIINQGSSRVPLYFKHNQSGDKVHYGIAGVHSDIKGLAYSFPLALEEVADNGQYVIAPNANNYESLPTSDYDPEGSDTLDTYIRRRLGPYGGAISGYLLGDLPDPIAPHTPSRAMLRVHGGRGGDEWPPVGLDIEVVHRWPGGSFSQGDYCLAVYCSQCSPGEYRPIPSCCGGDEPPPPPPPPEDGVVFTIRKYDVTGSQPQFLWGRLNRPYDVENERYIGRKERYRLDYNLSSHVPAWFHLNSVDQGRINSNGFVDGDESLISIYTQVCSLEGVLSNVIDDENMTGWISQVAPIATFYTRSDNNHLIVHSGFYEPAALFNPAATSYAEGLIGDKYDREAVPDYCDHTGRFNHITMFYGNNQGRSTWRCYSPELLEKLGVDDYRPPHDSSYHNRTVVAGSFVYYCKVAGSNIRLERRNYDLELDDGEVDYLEYNAYDLVYHPPIFYVDESEDPVLLYKASNNRWKLVQRADSNSPFVAEEITDSRKNILDKVYNFTYDTFYKRLYTAHKEGVNCYVTCFDTTDFSVLWSHNLTGSSISLDLDEANTVTLVCDIKGNLYTISDPTEGYFGFQA